MLGRIADLVGDRERFLALGRIDPADPRPAVGHDRAGAAGQPPRQRGQPAPRPGRARACGSRCFPGRARAGRADHPRHQRRARADLAARPDARVARPPSGRGLAAPRRPAARPGRRCSDIPAAELWAARCAARAQLVDMIARRATSDRLRRGEPLDYARGRRQRLRPRAPHHRLRAPARHLQAAAPGGAAARARAGADRRRAPGAVRVRRQGPSRRRRGQGGGAPGVRAQARAQRRRARRLPGGLRHHAGRPPGGRLRRLGQRAAAAERGQRHQRHEVLPRRRPATLGARRLVGRGLRRQQRLGDRRRRRRRPPRRRTSATPAPCSTCSSSRWCRCSTSATPTACRSAGWR